MPQGQWEQHQPVKSSPSTQIKRLFIHLSIHALGFEQVLPLGGDEAEQMKRSSSESFSIPGRCESLQPSRGATDDCDHLFLREVH